MKRRIKPVYRIAHFSDFHLSTTDAEFKRATRLLRHAIDCGIDHLVITGDVVDSAQTPIIGVLWARLRRWAWSSGTKITFAVGNHDIFPATALRLPPWWRKKWFPPKVPVLTGLDPTRRYEELCWLTRSSFRGRSVHGIGNPYPVAKVLSSCVALVALDTTRNGQSNPLRWAEGELPLEHQLAIKAFFEEHADKPHRIVAMHHTPWEVESESRLANMNFTKPKPEKVQRWLEECGATLVLCGHVHCETVRQKLTKRCWILQSGTAGGCDEDGLPDDTPRSYHTIDLLPTGRVRFVEHCFRGSEIDDL